MGSTWNSSWQVPRDQSPFWLCPLLPWTTQKRLWQSPCCWHLTSSPSLFLGLFQLKSSHLTSIHRLFCSWISHGFDLRAYELIPLELLMEKIVFSVVLYKAKSTDWTAQLNTAISLQLQGELNTQQCQIISSRVFPLDICRCKWGLLDTFCLSNHRLATTTAELTIISPSALRYL